MAKIKGNTVRETLKHLQDITGVPVFTNHEQSRAVNIRPDQVEELLGRLPEHPHLWAALKQYIAKTANPELFLNIKAEMGMKGFWYMKGYIRGLRDLTRRIDNEYKKHHKEPIILSRVPDKAPKPGIVAKPDQAKVG